MTNLDILELGHSKLWPTVDGKTAPPSRLDSMGLQDGCYALFWASGRPRLLGSISEGRLFATLSIEEHVDAGFAKLESYPYVAQKFHPDGLLEDFSPWDDDSKPYSTPLDFLAWVRQEFRLLKLEEPGPAVRSSPETSIDAKDESWGDPHP